MKDYLDGKESQYKELLQATGALAALTGQRPGPITVRAWLCHCGAWACAGGQAGTVHMMAGPARVHDSTRRRLLRGLNKVPWPPAFCNPFLAMHMRACMRACMCAPVRTKTGGVLLPKLEPYPYTHTRVRMHTQCTACTHAGTDACMRMLTGTARAQQKRLQDSCSSCACLCVQGKAVADAEGSSYVAGSGSMGSDNDLQAIMDKQLTKAQQVTVCMCVNLNLCVSGCVSVWLAMRDCVHVCIHVCMCVFLAVCICVCV